MKGIEQCFPVVLFIMSSQYMEHVQCKCMLYKEALTFETLNKIKSKSVIIQMKATEQYFPLVLCLWIKS